MPVNVSFVILHTIQVIKDRTVSTVAVTQISLHVGN